ncbi:guided entry of tail-anchored proteins factor 1 [Notothenia coriiceps]|uniref:Guided entry of tail-anchored proteins factor 1 n=1 Tax=Notothenia coriiceps TaxID=8208 RepID=A0A6I9MVE7_9TELE|nr:PREDICTED: tail-anchored protein insertion receptor WRB [Notothenia coriiceps]
MAASYAWFLVLGSVFLVNLMKTLLPSISAFFSRLVQKDAEQESEMSSSLSSGGVGITCWLVVCNKVVSLGLHAVS